MPDKFVFYRASSHLAFFFSLTVEAAFPPRDSCSAKVPSNPLPLLFFPGPLCPFSKTFLRADVFPFNQARLNVVKDGRGEAVPLHIPSAFSLLLVRFGISSPVSLDSPYEPF